MDDDQIKEQPKDVQQEEVKPKKENSDEKPKEEKPKRSMESLTIKTYALFEHWVCS